MKAIVDRDTHPVILPDNAVIEPAKRLAFDCVNVNALFPLTTLKLTSPILVAPMRDMASTSLLRDVSSSSKSNLKPSRVVDTAQPARH